MADTPTRGSLYRDTKTHHIGEYMGTLGGRWMLRPIGGGREWDVRPEHAQALTPDEELSARVADRNRRSAIMRGVA